MQHLHLLIGHINTYPAIRPFPFLTPDRRLINTKNADHKSAMTRQDRMKREERGYVKCPKENSINTYAFPPWCLQNISFLLILFNFEANQQKRSSLRTCFGLGLACT